MRTPVDVCLRVLFSTIFLSLPFRPDNLKVLFRPIAMMKPEMSIIAEVKLYAGGFENAQRLATKIVTIFKICAELLPPETFYDFGKLEFIASFFYSNNDRRFRFMSFR